MQLFFSWQKLYFTTYQIHIPLYCTHIRITYTRISVFLFYLSPYYYYYNSCAVGKGAKSATRSTIRFGCSIELPSGGVSSTRFILVEGGQNTQ